MVGIVYNNIMKNILKNKELLFLILITITFFLTKKKVIPNLIFVPFSMLTMLYFFPIKLILNRNLIKFEILFSVILSIIISISLISIYIDTKAINIIINLLIFIVTSITYYGFLNRDKIKLEYIIKCILADVILLVCLL